jgi:hypothetical protein
VGEGELTTEGHVHGRHVTPESFVCKWFCCERQAVRPAAS